MARWHNYKILWANFFFLFIGTVKSLLLYFTHRSSERIFCFTVDPFISWQSRDSISTVAPSCLFGLLSRTAWHNTVEIESRECQDRRSSTVLFSLFVGQVFLFILTSYEFSVQIIDRVFRWSLLLKILKFKKKISNFQIFIFFRIFIFFSNFSFEKIFFEHSLLLNWRNLCL